MKMSLKSIILKRGIMLLRMYKFLNQVIDRLK